MGKKKPDVDPEAVSKIVDVKVADRIADALVGLRKARPGNEALAQLRQQLAIEMLDLIPLAKANAKRGKPALLRLLLRFR